MHIVQMSLLEGQPGFMQIAEIAYFVCCEHFLIACILKLYIALGEHVLIIFIIYNVILSQIQSQCHAVDSHITAFSRIFQSAPACCSDPSPTAPIFVALSDTVSGISPNLLVECPDS